MTRPIVLVTGASRGIGRESSVALARAGFDCVLTARTMRAGQEHEYSPTNAQSMKRAMPGSLEETAQAVVDAGGRALPIAMDLLDRESVLAAVDRAETEWGGIDWLVNNAIYQGPGILDRVLDVTPEQIERIFVGNVVNQLALVQRLLPGMLERQRGGIVNVVSAAGMSDPPAPPDQGGWGYAYGASKAALIRMVGNLAVEHPGSAVRFVNLEPGLVLTETLKLQGLTETMAAQYGGAPPAVPAAVVTWLASDPGADVWHGKTVHAQKLCKELGLVDGWPPPSR